MQSQHSSYDNEIVQTIDNGDNTSYQLINDYFKFKKSDKITTDQLKTLKQYAFSNIENVLEAFFFKIEELQNKIDTLNRKIYADK